MLLRRVPATLILLFGLFNTICMYPPVVIPLVIHFLLVSVPFSEFEKCWSAAMYQLLTLKP